MTDGWEGRFFQACGDGTACQICLEAEKLPGMADHLFAGLVTLGDPDRSVRRPDIAARHPRICQQDRPIRPVDAHLVVHLAAGGTGQFRRDARSVDRAGVGHFVDAGRAEDAGRLDLAWRLVGAARRQTRARGSAAFLPGDGCAGPLCSADYRSTRFGKRQLQQAEQIDNGRRLLARWPTDCLDTQIYILNKDFASARAAEARQAAERPTA